MIEHNSVTGDCCVFTNKGVFPIECCDTAINNMEPHRVDTNIQVHSGESLNTATQLSVSESSDLYEIVLSTGQSIKATGTTRLWMVNDYKTTKDIQVEDDIKVYYGFLCFPEKYPREEVKLSKALTFYLDKKAVPSYILKNIRQVQAQFLNLLFDRLGTCRITSSNKGILELHVATFFLTKQLSSMLLNFGIPHKLKRIDVKNSVVVNNITGEYVDLDDLNKKLFGPKDKDGNYQVNLSDLADRTQYFDYKIVIYGKYLHVFFDRIGLTDPKVIKSFLDILCHNAYHSESLTYFYDKLPKKFKIDLQTSFNNLLFDSEFATSSVLDLTKNETMTMLYDKNTCLTYSTIDTLYDFVDKSRHKFPKSFTSNFDKFVSFIREDSSRAFYTTVKSVTKLTGKHRTYSFGFSQEPDSRDYVVNGVKTNSLI